jgi:hypothetical protein
MPTTNAMKCIGSVRFLLSQARIQAMLARSSNMPIRPNTPSAYNSNTGKEKSPLTVASTVVRLLLRDQLGAKVTGRCKTHLR